MSGPRAALTLADCPRPLGLAVSGGSDSLALMILAAEQFAPGTLRIATVNHGLRAEAAEEAMQVATQARRLGVDHDILDVDLGTGSDLQARARRARYAALGQWANTHGLAAVALGHTCDDQAETFLMRLARGSGVDGLAGMPAQFVAHGMCFIRPLLNRRRKDLQNELRARDLSWAEDPSNTDETFTRIRMRQALPELAPLGLSTERLSDTAGWMRAASEVLELAADQWIDAHATHSHGDALLNIEALRTSPVETATRVLTRVLCNIASAAYRPRYTALSHVLAQGQGTLHGCLITSAKGLLRITREVQAVHASGDPWDGRWALSGLIAPEHHIRALGEDGLSQLGDWRASAVLPRRSLLASPSVWHGTDLIAAPMARPGGPITAQVRNPLTRYPGSTG